MKPFILILLVLTTAVTAAQNRKMLVFDLQTNHVDTIETSSFDSLIIKDNTDFYDGDYDDDYCNLEETVPYENTFPGANYTKKVQASKLYDINDFPIRTSIKIFRIKNDSLKSRCSGSLISKRHVLTARHCVADFSSDTLSVKSLYVCPAFDNGEKNLTFGCSVVSKIYIFEKYELSDLCVLELDKPIGQQTGWISIGFDSDNTSIIDGIYYKFSYPAQTYLDLDPRSYNGDTLYCSYGKISNAWNGGLEVYSATGIPGESGSSLIKIENKKKYISYGVQTYSTNITHCRIRNVDFYPISSIIKNDLTLDAEDPIAMEGTISIYPNPTQGPIYIDIKPGEQLKKMVLFESSGKKLLENNMTNHIDLTAFPSGNYFLQIQTNKRSQLFKLLKY